VTAVAVLSDGCVVTAGSDWRVRLWRTDQPGVPIEIGTHAVDHRVGLPGARAVAGRLAGRGKYRVERGSAGHGLGGAAVERIAGVAQTLALIVWGKHAATDHTWLPGV